MTNIAILILLSITLSLLGVEGILKENGSDLDLHLWLTISPEPINKHIRRCDSLLLSKPTSKWEACGDLQTSALSLLGSGFVQHDTIDLFLNLWRFSYNAKYANIKAIH
jgi:hypothetical protein